MQIGFTLFLLDIIICCTCEFFVSGEDYQYEYPFEVDKDLMRVEKFIINYTKYMKNRFRAAFHMTINKTRDPKKDVCKFFHNLKIFMCKVLIKLNYFGFQFVDQEAEGLKCGRQEISLRVRLQKKLKTRDINMFRCPSLKYRSLETENFVTLPVSFYISNTQKEGTACLYIQDQPDYPIYPLQIFSNVEEDAIFKSLLKDFNNGEYLRYAQSLQPLAHLIAYSPTVQRQFLNFMDLRKQSKPYQKFSQLFMKPSTCGIPKSHKVYLCKNVSRHDYYKSQLDSEGYDEAKCRREEVLSHTNNDKRFTMVLFKCPPLYLKIRDSKQFLEHSLYLSTNSIEKSIIIYHRPNFKGKTIRLDSYVINLSNEILLMDLRRKREFLKRDHFAKPLMEMLTTEIAAPDLLPQQSLLFTPFTIIFDRKIVEDNVIQLTETMKVKEPYALFQSTFSTINVTGMRQREIMRLCQFILEEETKYHLTFPEAQQLNPTDDGIHKPIQVRLVMRDAEKLPTDKIRSRQCPPVIQNRFKYFVSTSAQKDAVIMYVRYDREEYYSIPDAFVNNIMKNIKHDRPASITRSISTRP